MPRHLGHKNFWENCYYSTYGLEKALRFAEQFYCVRGRRYNIRTGQKVDEPVCFDWCKCKGLDQVLNRKVKKAN